MTISWPRGDSSDPTADVTWFTVDGVGAIPPAPQPPLPKTVEDYLDKIIPWHRNKPKFVATVRLAVEPFVAQQDFLNALPSQFDLDTAVGVQLDQVGEWVGRSRYIRTPIANVFFSFDDPPRGFDLGVWKGPYDTDAGITRLDDETYRTLLRAKIAANTWDGTLPGSKKALAIMFPDGDTHVFIIDNQDMSLTYGVSGKIPSILFLALLADGYIPLKPEGVRANYRVTPVDGAPLFGFDVENEFISGFDTGAWGVPPSYFTS